MNSKSLNTILLSTNLALAIALVCLATRKPQAPSAAGKIAQTASHKARPLANAPRPRSYAAIVADSSWDQWVDTLREAGVPARVLARLVREGFDDQWQARQAEAQAAFTRGDLDIDGLSALNIEHDAEQEKAIRSALGEQEFRKWDMTNVLQSLNLRDIQLTAAEADALYDLQKSHIDRGNELLVAKLKGQIDYATMEEQQNKSEADYNAKLKALLGDQRYATLQGTNEVPGELKRNLSEAKLPVDVPFGSLVDLQNQWTERRGMIMGQLNEAKSQIANWEQEINRIDDQRDQEFQRVLGTNAFDAFTAAQDSRYKEMKRHAEAWGLDDAVANYLYRTIRYYEKAVDDYERQARGLEAQGKDVDWDAVNKNVKQFAQQNEQALRTYLGDERFDKIKSNEIFPFTPAKPAQ